MSRLLHDVRSAFSDAPPDLKRLLADAAMKMAMHMNKEAHLNGNEPTSERYVQHAAFFRRLVDAISGGPSPGQKVN